MFDSVAARPKGGHGEGARGHQQEIQGGPSGRGIQFVDIKLKVPG